MSSELVRTVLETAQDYVGFRSRANRVNGFGQAVHLDGLPWDGSFLETVMREAGVTVGTSLVSTASAIGYFLSQNRVYTKPQPGDIVFFGFATGEPLSQPHVGLVTSVRDFKRENRFTCIEGMTDSGLSRGPQELDGVYHRTRFATDVLLFARPKYAKTEPAQYQRDNSVSLARPSQFQKNKASAMTVQLQLALTDILGPQSFVKGMFDKQTASAVAAFQRRVGILPGTGVVDDRTLAALAVLTKHKYFSVRAFDKSEPTD